MSDKSATRVTPTAQPGPSPDQQLVIITANPAQIERLAASGVLKPEQLAAARQAGQLEVSLPAQLVADFLNPPLPTAEQPVEQLALIIHEAGMSGPARLLLAGLRPLSFFSSQLLLLFQPAFSRVSGFGERAGYYSSLLEDRRNIDALLLRLDQLQTGDLATKKKSGRL